MKKQNWFLLLAALFTALLLCGCSQYDDKYEDGAFLAGQANHYVAIIWTSNPESDGTYSLHAGSFSGVRTLRSFTVEEEGTLCEVIPDLICTKGEAKLLLVDARERTLLSQWPLDSQDPLSATLPAGRYELRLAGKSAGFDGAISLVLNGQISPWDDALEEIQASAEQALSGGWKEVFREAADSLRQVLGDKQNAA